MCDNQHYCANRLRCAERLTTKLTVARREFLRSRSELADKLTHTVQPIASTDLGRLLSNQSDWRVWRLVEFALTKGSAADIMDAALLTRKAMLQEEEADGRLSAAPLVNEIHDRERAARRRFLHATAEVEAFRD